jgi:hypothetical protein
VNALGILFKGTGRYDEAAQAYAEALDILRAGRGGEPPGGPRFGTTWPGWPKLGVTPAKQNRRLVVRSSCAGGAGR